MEQRCEGGIDSWDLAIHLLLVSDLQHGSHILRDELFWQSSVSGFLCVCFHPNSSFNLSFVPPPQSQSVKRPGLARRRPKRQPVDVGALLQDLKNNSLTSALPGKVEISFSSFRETLALSDRQEALLSSGLLHIW